MNETEFKKIVEKVYELHVKIAPAIPLAVEMVFLAQEKLGDVKLKTVAISETRACLPDAIQVLTGCTIGNGYLKIKDEIGRFALTLFDRADGRGVRVYVDLAKIDQKTMPETYKFFRRIRDPRVNDDMKVRRASNKLVIDEFYACGRRAFLSWEKVKIEETAKPPISPVYICKKCGESFHSKNDKNVCSVCSGEQRYYLKAE